MADRFQCRGCGACCRVKGGIVRVGETEIARIAAYLGMGEQEFIDRETEIAPDRRGLVLRNTPDDVCVWLDGDNRCRIHAVKPDRCRTFPYEWRNADSCDVCPALGGLKVTAFQRRVYAEALKIPRGTVISYGELARRIGSGSARAVGQALRVNPFAPEVPCHRVVAADGSLTGFCGERDTAALARKRSLLESEGVEFDDRGRVRLMKEL